MVFNVHSEINIYFQIEKLLQHNTARSKVRWFLGSSMPGIRTQVFPPL